MAIDKLMGFGKKAKLSGFRMQFLLFTLVFTHALCAQDYVDVVKLNYNNTSLNTFKDHNASTRVQELDLELTMPLAINSSTNFLTGFLYERIQTKLFADESENVFSSVVLKVGFAKTYAGRWSGTYMLLPKIASDFQKISKKDFQLGGFFLLRYAKTEQLLYKVGLYANGELFGPWIVPLLGMYYLSPTKKTEVNLTVPIVADVNYAFRPRVAIGFNYSGQVRTYHLTSTPTSDNPAYVARATNEVSTYLKFNLGKNLILQTKVGHSAGRYYRVYDEDDKVSFGIPLVFVGDHRQQLNTDFKDGWVYQFLIMYRIYRDQSLDGQNKAN